MPDISVLNFGSAGVQTVYVCTVYTRKHWADDWTEQPNWHCLEAAWSCAPALPCASFTYRYGVVKQIAAANFVEHLKLQGYQRAFVKVSFVTNTGGELKWYGVLELEVDEQFGAIVDPPPADERKVHASGQQTWTAYGLELLLAKHRIRTMFFERDGAAIECGQRVAFNQHALGNRTAAQVGGVYLFERNLQAAARWSSRQIVKYLLKHQTPKDNLGAVLVPFALHAEAADAIADWDFPELPQEEAQTLSLLNRLLDRRRLTCWWLTVDETATPDLVKLHVDTLTRADVEITFPGATPIPANRHQYRLVYDEDQLTRGTVRDSDVQRYDVVACRGARELCVGSFSVADGTLAPDWLPALQYLYDAAASGTAGYAAAAMKDKQKRNSDARSVPFLEAVYSRFKVPYTWNQEVGDGEGGPTTALFPDPLGGAWDVYYPGIYFEHNLPLLVGVDYSGKNIADGSFTEPKENREERDLAVFVKRPESGRWARGEDLGRVGEIEQTASAEKHHCSIHARTPAHSHVIELRVTGAPQHALAFGDFAPLAADKACGNFSFRTGVIVTACISNGRRVTGYYPPLEPQSIDCVRWLEIDAGEHFRKIYVAPGTVVDVNAAGALLRSTGGYIPTPGPEDHETQLRALARIAWAWYGVPHRVLDLASFRLRGDLGLGAFVCEIGNELGGGHQTTLNSPITEMRITWPLTFGGGTGEAPQQHWQTWAGELDPLQTGPSSTVSELGSRPKRIPKL